MLITLEQTAKRYNYEWIFRNLSFSFTPGNSYAILGSNGSGKSTLLQCISGFQMFSDGKIKYDFNGQEVHHDKVFQNISIASPYQELIEEMTLAELVNFQQSFKPLLNGVDTKTFIDILHLSKHANKQVKLFSSGMKQRVKLGLAILSDVPAVLLDEPATNLDNDGLNFYLNLINGYSKNRIVIVCSNNEKEYSFCKERISMSDYKQ